MKDLRIFSKQHLEQYYLSLNHCHIETEEEKTNHVNVTVNEANIVHSFDHWKAKSADPEIFAALSIPVQCWRPYAFESEREYFTKGRCSNEEISLVPMVKNSISTDVIEKCGVNHRFYGRVALNSKYNSNDFPSFIIENFKIGEGKWYYCVRLPEGGLAQIGWATDGYAPGDINGVGDDRYSWSYDGSRGAFFYEKTFTDAFNDLRWKRNDTSNIKYWLNGKLLGTAFEHNTLISSSSTKCDLFHNGSSTRFYPSVSMQCPDTSTRSFELILSPEDISNDQYQIFHENILFPKNRSFVCSPMDCFFFLQMIINN